MKNSKKSLEKLSAMFVGCLTIVMAINANTASCYLLNEPKEPKQMSKYKLFK